MMEEGKARIDSLSSQAESFGLLMRKGDSEGFYHLAKEEPPERGIAPRRSRHESRRHRGFPHGGGGR